MVLSMPHATPLNAQSNLQKQNSSRAWLFVHKVQHLSMNCYALIGISCDCLYTSKGKAMSNACVEQLAEAELEPLMASPVQVGEILVTVCKIKKTLFDSKCTSAFCGGENSGQLKEASATVVHSRQYLAS